MKITVLDKASIGSDLDLTVLCRFGELEVFDYTEDNQINTRIKDSDIVLVNKLKMNENALKGTRVKLICEFATGYDNIDIQYAKDQGIAVTNVIGYSTDSVVLTTVTTVLSLMPHIFEYTDVVKSGEYSKGSAANVLTPVYHEVRSLTWGIIGYGNIGKAVGKVAEALGANIIYHRKHHDGHPNCTDLDTLLKQSDIITIHTPLNAETRNLISKEKIKLLKKNVIIVNEARGAVWDEEAIATALSEKKIGAVGCDVYTKEPFQSSSPMAKIANLKNVCLTPHMAWGAYEARVRCLDETCKNIDSYLNGERRCRVDL